MINSQMLSDQEALQQLREINLDDLAQVAGGAGNDTPPPPAPPPAPPTGGSTGGYHEN